MPAGMRHNWGKNTLDAKGSQDVQVITGCRLGHFVDSAGRPPISRLSASLSACWPPWSLSAKSGLWA